MNIVGLSCDVSRFGYGVRLVSDPATVSWIKRRSQGYFVITDTIGSGTNYWKLYAGGEYAPALHWGHFTRSSSTGEFCSYRVNPTNRAIAIDLPPGPWRSLYALRVIRNILRWEMFLSGAIFIQADCITRNGRGVALIGPSRSGKTTMMLQFLRQREWAYVTEDDLTILPKSDGNVLALGWPGSIRVRRSMLLTTPEIRDAEARLSHPANELEKGLDPELALLRMFPEELCALMGCAQKPETALSSIVCLKWANCPSVRVMKDGAVARHLNEAWDVLPERRQGARPPQDLEVSHDWHNTVFDPFLLDYYGVPALTPYASSLKHAASQLHGLQVNHVGSVADVVAIAKALDRE